MKDRKIKQNEAIERQTVSDARTINDRLSQLDKRPGSSLKERTKLASKMSTIISKNIDELEKEPKEKFKKGVKK